MRRIMNRKIFVRFLIFFLLRSPLTSVAVRRGDEICRFPAKWEGTWFQSGVRSLITIEMNRLSSKGRCLHSEGDKYLVVDDKSVCYRCVVLHEKHINVLQYKETFCHDRNSLHNLCSLISGDALLFSMFRLNPQPIPCPIKPPMTFTYSRGRGECRNPVSNLDACIEDSRMLFRYQACPDISGTESAIEEVECIAIWKEGNARYLVAKVSHIHITSNEDRFRCFIYEKSNPLQASEITLNRKGGFLNYPGKPFIKDDEPYDFRLAQSGDATCTGLFSPLEGSRTMTLKKTTIPNNCKYPAWMTYFQQWHTLDYRKSYTFHEKNTTLKILDNSAVDVVHSSTSGILGDIQEVLPTITGLNGFSSENGEVRLVCSEEIFLNQTQMNIIAHFTVGCQSGFVCLWFYRRDLHVMELQSGRTTRRIEEACHPSQFNSNMPYVTLVTTNPEPKECPYTGKFSVAGISQMERKKRSAVLNGEAAINVNDFGFEGEKKEKEKEMDNGVGGGEEEKKRRRRETSEESCEDEVTTLEIGCDTSDVLEFRSQCAGSSTISAYSCHGRWTENDTNFLITTPQSRTSIGAKRYCFIYKEVGGVIHFSSSSQSCTRNINAGVDGVLAFNATNIGQCQQTSVGHSMKPKELLWVLFVALAWPKVYYGDRGGGVGVEGRKN